MRTVLSIVLSVAAILAVIACPLWASTHTPAHHCCSKSKKTSQCPVNICEVGAPYLTQGKADTTVPHMTVAMMPLLPPVAMHLEPVFTTSHFDGVPPSVSPPDIHVLLHVFLI